MSYNTHWSHVPERARRASAELIASIDAIHGVAATAVLERLQRGSVEGRGRQPLVEAGFVDTYDDLACAL